MCEFWAKDSVEKIVLSAKCSNQILVILLEGEDELSKKVRSSFNVSAIQSLSRNGFNFVGVRLKEGSENFRHFTKIYSKWDSTKNLVNLKVPTVIFIGVLGLPLAVIEINDEADFENFPYHLNSAFTKFYGTSAKEAVSIIYEDPNLDHMTKETFGSAFKVASKVVVEREKKKRSSSERPVMEDKKIKLVSNDALEFDDEDTLSKVENNVIDEPVATSSNDSSHEEALTKKEEKLVNGNVDTKRSNKIPGETRILFRLQNRNVLTKMFSIDTRLETVRQFVTEQFGFRCFELSFLSRLKKEDDLLTLEELNMVPSAVLVVIPDKKNKQVSNDSKKFDDGDTVAKVEKNVINEPVATSSNDSSHVEALTKKEEKLINGNVVIQRSINVPGETRILFRLQNRNVLTKMFSIDTRLETVRQFVTEQFGFRCFELSFLSRLKKEDDLLTLEQLNMVPSAVLVVIPVNSSPKSTVLKGFSHVTSFFWYITMPFIAYIQHLGSLIFGNGRRFRDLFKSSGPSNSPPQPPSGGGGGGGRSPHQPSSQKRTSGSNRFRGSNIHTLRSIENDDNSQNTYNGNSTQQM